MKKGKKLRAGKKFRIFTKEKEFQGKVLESYDPNIILLKLESGYNIGIEKRKIRKIKEIKEKGKVKTEKVREIKFKENKNLPGIAIIVTGGTIASKIDYKTGGVMPITKPEEILQLAPKINEIAKITSIEKPFSVVSENMSHEEWKKLAKLCTRLLNKKENKGVIILQGTDILHYSSAALSFMLQDINKPVVLTYAQRSIDRGSSDAFMNLTCAAYMATSNLAEVMLVGHGTTNDNYCLAIPGTKARKMHTSRRDTFRPINALPFTKIYFDGKIEKIKEGKKTSKIKAKAEPFFNEKVALIKWHPNSSPKIIDFYKARDYKGIVIEATGLGHVATEGKLSWLETIKRASKNMVICFATQCLYGRLDPFVYSPGRKLREAGVIFLKDMLPETAYIKLAWLLGKHKSKDKIRKLMLKNMAHEFNPRLTVKDFTY
jgi:glutamyl-tRNA(Gln) amidotransferase subunit D